MKAEDLLIWDKIELARLLADNYSDSEDLIEAIPSLIIVESFEKSLLKEYVECNWMFILAGLDQDMMINWLEEKIAEEELENWRAECLVEEAEYYDELEIQHIKEYLEYMESFRNPDFAELRGYPSKTRRS